MVNPTSALAEAQDAASLKGTFMIAAAAVISETGVSGPDVSVTTADPTISPLKLG